MLFRSCLSDTAFLDREGNDACHNTLLGLQTYALLNWHIERLVRSCQAINMVSLALGFRTSGMVGCWRPVVGFEAYREREGDARSHRRSPGIRSGLIPGRILGGVISATTFIQLAIAFAVDPDRDTLPMLVELTSTEPIITAGKYG